MQEVHQAAALLTPGDPLEPETQMGAIIDEKQMNTVLGYIEKGQQEGAEITLGGHRTLNNLGGFYIEPTIFENVRNDMTIAREEIFGPVLSVIEAEDVEDAVRTANDTKYGLAASVWTGDISTAHKTARSLHAGSVWVNCFDQGGIVMPFGGMKQSGIGRDRSHHALEKYTEMKSSWIQL